MTRTDLKTCESVAEKHLVYRISRLCWSADADGFIDFRVSVGRVTQTGLKTFESVLRGKQVIATFYPFFNCIDSRAHAKDSSIFKSSPVVGRSLGVDGFSQR